MEFSQTKRSLRAAGLAGTVMILVIAGCSTPRAPAVDCAGKLRPVNAPAAPSGALSQHAAPAGAERPS